jgi:ubiquinone biosynthesis protein UbiJ
MSSAEAVAAEMLATLANAGLKLDPLSEPRLAALEGRSVRFEVTLPGRETAAVLTARIAKASLQFCVDAEPEPGQLRPEVDAIVRGSITELLAWFQGAGSRGLSFEGDEQLLASLGGLLSDYQPDLALPLSRILGAETASNLLGFAETALAATRSALQAAGNAAADGARARFTDTSELNQAITTVEDLNLKVDRLLARVALLETNNSNGAP